MTTTVWVDPTTLDEIDLDGVIDVDAGVQYIGKAKRVSGDDWVCLASVGGCLCRVAVSINGGERHRGGGHD
jgi:hypothetical protein